NRQSKIERRQFLDSPNLDPGVIDQSNGGQHDPHHHREQQHRQAPRQRQSISHVAKPNRETPVLHSILCTAGTCPGTYLSPEMLNAGYRGSRAPGKSAMMSSFAGLEFSKTQTLELDRSR